MRQLSVLDFLYESGTTLLGIGILAMTCVWDEQMPTVERIDQAFIFRKNASMKGQLRFSSLNILESLREQSLCKAIKPFD